MGELSGIKPPQMEWNDSDLPMAFKSFKQYCQLIFDGPLNAKEDKVKATYILLWVGEEGRKIFNSFGLTDDEKAKPDAIFNKFTTYLEPKSNFRIARYQLQGFRQADGESVDSFLARCKIQAQKCRFSDAELEERLIEQLIIGTCERKVQEVLLGKDDKLKLDKAMDIARTREATVNDMKSLEQQGASASIRSHDTNIDAVRQNSNPKCGKCGLSHRKKCPAQGTRCRKCNQWNHWEQVCRNKQAQDQKAKPLPRKQPGKWMPQAKTSQNKVHTVEETNSDSDELCFETIQIDSSNVNSVKDEAFAKLQVKLPNVNHPNPVLKVKVDTGAQGNILPLRIYRNMFPDQVDENGFPTETAPSCTKLTAYNGTQIPQYGVCSIKCSYGDKETEAMFYLADVAGPAICGLPTCCQLNLVELHCAVSTCSSKVPLPAIKNKDVLQALYPDRFDGIGKFEGKYHIVTDPDVPPVVHAPRKCPIHIKDDIKKELDEMVSLGVIKPVTEPTDWVSSVAYSQKSNGRWRVCLDPKNLNQAVKRSHHHTPTLEEITHKFKGSTIFSKLDARHGYWSVVLDEESSYLTTFNSPFGRFRFTRLPFGLCVSQDIFQQKMDFILEKCPGTVGIADDIAVHGPTEEEHDANLYNLMLVAREHGLVFNLDKCVIKERMITFFGMLFSAEGVHPDPEKIEAIRAIQVPQDAQELQSFLSIATYMAPFIPNLSALSEPLRNLLKKGTDFHWSPSHSTAFEKIKQAICRQVSLTYFDRKKETVLQVDASLRGLGSALVQEGKVVAFASRSLTDTETRYANIEREMLAVVVACEKFHSYLFGKRFIVESDHKPLEMIHFKNLTAAPPRLQRMLLRIQGYDFTIKYKPGTEMLLADPMSRLIPLPCEESLDLQKVCLVRFSDEKWNALKRDTSSDPELSPLREIIYSGWPGKQKQVPVPLKKYWAYRDELSIENGLVLKGERVIIPELQREDILEKIHQAHQGVAKCQLRAKSCVFWPNINKDIEARVQKCEICQESQNTQTKETLEPHEVPTRPWQVVGTDLFTWNGDEYLLMCDYYSKFPIVKKIPSGQSTGQTVVRLTKCVMSEQGVPEIVISDNGPQYDCQSYKQFSKEWGFQHVTSSPRYPQSNGFIERQVQTVKNTLDKAVKSGRDPHMSMLCLRSTPIDSQLPSPAELLYQRKLQANLPIRVENQIPDRDRIAQHLMERQQSMKYYYDRNAHDISPLTTGQPVRIQDQATKKWLPGTVICTRPEPRSYEVQTQSGSILRRNRRHLRPANSGPVVISSEEEPAIAEADDHVVEPSHDVPESTKAPHSIVSSTARDIGDTSKPLCATQNPGTYRTRSGRAVIRPARFTE